MIYLLHFNRPYKHACHYLGYCEAGNLEQRVERHRKGDGARLIQVITNAGIGFEVARVWSEGTRKDERRMKGRGLKPLCPICKGSDKNEGQQNTKIGKAVIPSGG